MQVLPVEPPRGEMGEDAEEEQELSYISRPRPTRSLAGCSRSTVRNALIGPSLEVAAAEQGSRRTAMKHETDNAGDMLDNLRRSYNRARQAQITQEISEIVGGAAALE